MKKNVFFRADGNSKIGLGHVIRSLALADMLREEFNCHFVIRNPLETLKKKILEVCERIIVLPDTKDTDAESEIFSENYLSQGDIVVLDGYHFGFAYQQSIRNRGCKLVCIDDIQHTHYIADAVINHAPGLSPNEFSVIAQTQLLLGSDYALLRRPFLCASVQPRTISKIKSVFVCFGGADHNNLSLKVLELFSAFKGEKYHINMVLGGANNFKDRVRAFAKRISDFKVNLFENLSAEDMVKVMQQSDCAIVPASSIMYEVLAVKMPVIGGYYVDNQVNIYHCFNETELIYGVGDLNLFSDYESALNGFTTQKINRTIYLQSNLGIEKVKRNFLNIFQKINSKSVLKVRKAKESDLMTYFNWVNDNTVRENSFSQDEITLENHANWFKENLVDDSTIFYIFEENNIPVGQLRFNLNDKIAVINYSIASRFRGRGFGKIIVQDAINKLLEEESVEKIKGIVKWDNVASVRIFEKIGFLRSTDVKIKDELYYSYYLETSNENAIV